MYAVDGNWGEWRSWSTCSRSCAIGNQTRTRTCDDPAANNGGASCNRNDSYIETLSDTGIQEQQDIQDCNESPCTRKQHKVILTH